MVSVISVWEEVAASSSVSYPEDGGSKVLLNDGNHYEYKPKNKCARPVQLVV